MSPCYTTRGHINGEVMSIEGIQAGDWVEVSRYQNGYYRGKVRATVIDWTRTGLLKVKFDDGSGVKLVNPDTVKLIKKA